jgi:hypothetical protein
MATNSYVYVLIVIFVLLVLGLLALCILTCLGVRWCCRIGHPKPKVPYVPPGFSLQRLDTIRVETPEYSAQIAAENAFLDALPGLPPR